MPADDRLWAENCNRAEDGREPTIEPNKQKAIGVVSCGRLDTCRRSTLSCWRRIRISATSFVLGLKNEAMIWRISRSTSIIKWQGYRVSASRLAESNFRYTQGAARPSPHILPVLIWRLLDEERFLRENLSGYADYQTKVKYRLVPFVW